MATIKAPKAPKAPKGIAAPKVDAQAVLAKAEQAKAEQAPKLEIFGLGDTPYSTLESNRKAYAAWIIALGLTSGSLRMMGDSVSGAKGNYAALKENCGTAFGHWKNSLKRIDGQGFTVGGINEINARLQGKTKGYNTTLEIVKQAMAAQTKGGTHTINGLSVKMAAKPRTY